MDAKGKNKILITDDHNKNIQVLGSLLRDAGYSIGVANNGQKALDILNENPDFDLILMDVSMPVMNGFEACKAIRENDLLDDIPVIFLTALTEKEDIVQGFKAGGQDFVTKPFHSEELLSRVKTHIDLKNSKDRLKKFNELLEERVCQRTAELRRVNKKLLSLDAAKTEFLNIISHEIRTPLNGMKGILSVLSEYELPEDANELMSIMDLSAERLQNFALKALDITYFNTKGSEGLRLKEVNIKKLIEEQLFVINDKIKEKNMKMAIKASTSNLHISIDPNYMAKCFEMILDNSLQFGNNETIISIDLLDKGGYLVVRIENDGEQFPENFDINLLTPFETEKHVDNNPALSLFLCRQIVEAHKGKIEVGNMNAGAFVEIYLPIFE